MTHGQNSIIPVTLDNYRTLAKYPITLEVVKSIASGEVFGIETEGDELIKWPYWPSWIDILDNKVEIVHDEEASESTPQLDDSLIRLPWLDFSTGGRFITPDLFLRLKPEELVAAARDMLESMSDSVPPPPACDELKLPKPPAYDDSEELSETFSSTKLILTYDLTFKQLLEKFGAVNMLVLSWKYLAARAKRLGLTHHIDGVLDHVAARINHVPPSVQVEFDKVKHDDERLVLLLKHLNESEIRGVQQFAATCDIFKYTRSIEGDLLRSSEGVDLTWRFVGSFVDTTPIKVMRKLKLSGQKMGEVSVTPKAQAMAWAILFPSFNMRDFTPTGLQYAKRRFKMNTLLGANRRQAEVEWTFVNEDGTPLALSDMQVAPYLLFGNMDDKVRASMIARALLTTAATQSILIKHDANVLHPLGLIFSLCCPDAEKREGRIVISPGDEILKLENARSLRSGTIWDKDPYKSGFAFIDYGEGQIEQWNPEIVRMLHIAIDIVNLRDSEFCSRWNLNNIEENKLVPVSDFQVVIAADFSGSSSATAWVSLISKLAEIFKDIPWYLQSLGEVNAAVQVQAWASKVVGLGEIQAGKTKNDEILDKVVYVRLDNPAGANDYQVNASQKKVGTIDASFDAYSKNFIRVYQLVSFSVINHVRCTPKSIRILKGDVAAPMLKVVRTDGSNKLAYATWRDLYSGFGFAGMGMVPVGHNPHTAQRVLVYDRAGDMVTVRCGYNSTPSAAARWGVYESLACSIARFEPSVAYRSDSIRSYGLKSYRIGSEVVIRGPISAVEEY